MGDFSDSDLKKAFDTMTPEEWRLKAKDAELAFWKRQNAYCGCCGAKTERHPVEQCYVCPKCGNRSYPRIMPAVITVILRNGGEEILLQRNAHYGVPYWTLVAGFVDAGETFEQAVAREALEESNVRVNNIRYFGSQIWPFPSQIMVGYFSDYESGELKPDGEEVMASAWFDRAHLPELPRPISIAHRMIEAWRKGEFR